MPKIKEVDELMRGSPGQRPLVREVHPEVSFSLLKGEPILTPKSKPIGRATRRALLEPSFGESIGKAIDDCKARGAKPMMSWTRLQLYGARSAFFVVRIGPFQSALKQTGSVWRWRYWRDDPAT